MLELILLLCMVVVLLFVLSPDARHELFQLDNPRRRDRRKEFSLRKNRVLRRRTVDAVDPSDDEDPETSSTTAPLADVIDDLQKRAKSD